MKYRYFCHLCIGDDPDSERVYRHHLDARKAALAKINLGMDGKSGTDEYVHQARALLVSMATKGFDPAYAIPIDPDGELLGGAHRTACALALGIGDVPVKQHAQRAWAPAWGLEWFKDNGMATDDLARLRNDQDVLAKR